METAVRIFVKQHWNLGMTEVVRLAEARFTRPMLDEIEEAVNAEIRVRSR